MKTHLLIGENRNACGRSGVLKTRDKKNVDCILCRKTNAFLSGHQWFEAKELKEGQTWNGKEILVVSLYFTTVRVVTEEKTYHMPYFARIATENGKDFY